MSDDPASIEAWQTQDNWCTRNGWDLLTYLRSKPTIVTTDTYGQLVTDYKATEAVRNLTKQHQERCEMAADEIERIQKKLLGEENAYDILRLENERIRAELVSVTNKLNLERDEGVVDIERLRAERDEARRYSCDLEARIIMLEEDRRDTSNNFGTNPCSEIILPDYPLARDPKEIAKRKGWDCFKENL